MYPYQYGYHETSFDRMYRCYPASSMNKLHIETGDKIIMPQSAFDRLASLHIDYPMLFSLRNDSVERVSHCGVLEFTAEEGTVYMPNWMMENLRLQEGDFVQIKNATLRKCTYVKLQPHTKDFLDIANPKAVLETALRNYSCLTTGDTIMVAYNEKKFYIDVVATKPSNKGVSVIETDCEVDFARPLDYKKPAVPERPAAFVPKGKAPSRVDELQAPSRVDEGTEPKFSPFTGAGRRLDGTPVPYRPAPVSALPSSKDERIQGKIAIGSNASRDAPKATHKEAGKKAKQQQQPEKKEEPKFQPFSGKKYSLMG